jgi:hypothetical protein
VLTPTGGICRDKRNFVNSFSAQIWANHCVDCREALRLKASVERSPAMSAMATMLKATKTSMSVKPEALPHRL